MITSPNLPGSFHWLEYGLVVGGLLFIVSVLWKWLRRSLEEQKAAYEERLEDIEARQLECEQDRAELRKELTKLSLAIAKAHKNNG